MTSFEGIYAMSPITLLYNINNMRHMDLFDYCRYEMKPIEVRKIVNYYHNEFQEIKKLDSDLLELNETIKPKIQILIDRLS